MELKDFATKVAELVEADPKADLETIANSLGDRVKKSKAESDETGKRLAIMCKALGVKADADDLEKAINSRLRELRKDLVPSEDLAAATARIETLEAADAERNAKELVANAVKAGKIVAGTREWALGFAKDDADGFGQWVENAPKVAPADGRLSGRASKRSANKAQDADDIAADDSIRNIEAHCKKLWDDGHEACDGFTSVNSMISYIAAKRGGLIKSYSREVS